MRRSLSSSFRSLIRYSRFRINPEFPSAILLDVHKPIVQRTLRMLLINFQMAEIPVYIRVQPGRKAISIANILRWHPNAWLLWTPVKSGERLILCTDRPEKYEGRSFFKKIIVHYDLSPNLQYIAGHYACPYIMHPQLYCEYGDHNRLEKYRNSRRRLRILFSGNFNPDYRNSLINEWCEKISRYEIIEHLIRHPAVKFLRSNLDVQNLFSDSGEHALIVIDNQVRINQGQWMELLSQADFFICAPGLLMPMSHNLIESMAIGTIPLTNYADWLFPNLKNGKEAILFSSLDELDLCIQKILSMSEEDILRLRQQVITYYTNHLNHRQLMTELLQFPENTTHIHLINEEKNSIINSMKSDASR